MLIACQSLKAKLLKIIEIKKKLACQVFCLMLCVCLLIDFYYFFNRNGSYYVRIL